MLDTVISQFIEQQFPEIYREEGPFFIEFLKQYYVWLETDESSPVYQARHHLTNHDVDTTTDNYILYFKEKYLKNIQINTTTNTTQLIKNSIDLYRSKGTENAIKLFFDLIFGAEAEVYYPSTDIWRLSNAQWVLPKYIEITSMPANRLLVGRPIIGVNSGATAFVESLVRRKIKNNFVEVLYISAISGTFETGEIIKLSSDVSVSLDTFPTIIGSLTSLTVTDGGTNFSKGQIVKLESRTGNQGRALVDSLQSVTGLVDFTLEDGGWGYSDNTEINISDKVLKLSNVTITSSSNTSMDGKIQVVQQAMANVQWYNNTASFAPEEKVYNYYANGTLIGINTILSAEYGTNTTTNFFLLNTISGNNYMDPSSPYYYSAANTKSFQVQNAGWTDDSANGVFVGFSSNVTVYCTGNSQLFTTGGIVYQVGSDATVYSSAGVKSITQAAKNSFYLSLTDREGLFLTDKPLLADSTSNTGVSISSIDLDMGLDDVNGTFRTNNSNFISATSNTDVFSAVVDQTYFGVGANTGFDSDIVNSETISININYLRDHINVAVQENWLNTASYGASLNTANLTYKTLEQALQFDVITIGTIPRLKDQNPGTQYSYAPFVDVVDPLIAPLQLYDFVIRYDSLSGIFVIGEEVTQVVNGAKGIVKFANTSEIHVRRLTFEDRWVAGNSSNDYLVVGTDSGHSAYPTEVTYDTSAVAGHNAIIDTKVTSSTSTALSLKVTDSGFCFRDGDEVSFSDIDDLYSGSAIASVETSGVGSGYYSTSSGFLSSSKYLYDGDYYQDFSYEIRSPVTAGRYIDMLKNILHTSGTQFFSGIMKNDSVDCSANVPLSTVGTANIADITPLAVADFQNGIYTIGGVSKNVTDLFITNTTDLFGDGSYWDPSADIVPGTGIYANAVNTFISLFASDELNTAIDLLNGLVVVVDYTFATTGNNGCFLQVDVSTDNGLWGGWAATDVNGVNDPYLAYDEFPPTSLGNNKTAFLISGGRPGAESTNGAPCQIGTSNFEEISGNPVFVMGAGAFSDGDTPTPITIRSATIYALQETPVLPVLSALTIPEPLAVADFASGVYSIGGVSKSLEDLFGPESMWGPPMGSITPGIGFSSTVTLNADNPNGPGDEGNSGFNATPELMAALGDFSNVGFTVVADVFTWTDPVLISGEVVSDGVYLTANFDVGIYNTETQASQIDLILGSHAYQASNGLGWMENHGWNGFHQVAASLVPAATGNRINYFINGLDHTSDYTTNVDGDGDSFTEDYGSSPVLIVLLSQFLDPNSDNSFSTATVTSTMTLRSLKFYPPQDATHLQMMSR